MSVQLSAEQQGVVHNVVKALKREKRMTTSVGGFAGVGKSTVVNFLIHEVFPTYAVCAYTGKAANVLRRKGVVDASTIHSLIYEPRPDLNGNVTFDLRAELPCDGIIVDEASMVSRDIYNDLLTFNLPILFVGDHGQLEPIGSDFNLMKDPDFKLETIHRNAGEISRFAEWIRMGKNAVQFPVEATNKIEFISKYEIEERKLWTDVDQIICAYNKTRVLTNTIVRDRLGRTPDPKVAIGERIMCLRNNKKKGVFNGMQGVVRQCRHHRGRHLMDFDSYGENFADIPFNPDQFNLEKTLPMEDKDDPIPFDYSYCITGHKSQGDQFNTLMAFEQRCKLWDHMRWSYTVASRAVDKIYWVRGM